MTDSTIAIDGEKRKTSAFLFGALSVAVSALSFFFLYWNHFVGYRAGGGVFIAWSWMLNHGFMPYRDFFCPVPIFYILRGSALLSAFGDHFIALRLCGVFERALLAVLIYIWLSRLFSIRAAVFGAILTSVLGSCDIADPLDVYTQESILFSVGSALVASFAMDEKRSAKAAVLLSFASGLLAAWALMTKQTIGLGSSLAIPIVATACLLSLDGWKRALRFALSYIAGWLSCMGIFSAWLASHGILVDFLQQAFVKGPAAKASSPMTFVTRFLVRNRDLFVQLCVAVTGIVISWKTLLVARRTPEGSHGESDRIVATVPVLIMSVCGIAFGAICAYYYTIPILPQLTLIVGRQLRLLYMLYMFYAECALFFLSAWLAWKKKLSRREAQMFLYLGLALSNAAMVSLSFPFYEAVLVPGIGLLAASLLENLAGWKRKLLFVLLVVSLAGAAVWKLRMPFEFEDFREAPAVQANLKSIWEKQAGFELPEDMNTFIDETAKIIKENSTPNDTIYVYPDGALFYALCDRRPPTYSLSHNMDTTNDDLAKSDAKLILETRPAVLVYYRNSEEVMKVFEDCWRAGKPSGNREIMAACETLAKQYKLAKAFHFKDRGLGVLDISVYVRPN